MAKHYTFKVANMRKEQRFILYPYSGGDTIFLQSDKRMMQVSLKTGKGVINRTNKNYANTISIAQDPVKMELSNDVLLSIQKHLWENNGADGSIGGFVSFENKELFSI